jgi:hypothetical protein
VAKPGFHHGDDEVCSVARAVAQVDMGLGRSPSRKHNFSDFYNCNSRAQVRKKWNFHLCKILIFILLLTGYKKKFSLHVGYFILLTAGWQYTHMD